MLQYAVKVLITLAIIIAVTELSRRQTLWAAALASLPLTSLLAFVWIYTESGDAAAVAQLAHNILWLVIPSLLLFVLLPVLLHQGLNFWLSLALSSTATAIAYLGVMAVLRRLGTGA